MAFRFGWRHTVQVIIGVLGMMEMWSYNLSWKDN